MSLRAIVSLPSDVEEISPAGVASHSLAATSTSRTLSARNHRGNGGDPLRCSSSDQSVAHRGGSSGEGSVHAGPTRTAAAGTVTSARTTSPSYRHNPYLASPSSEAFFVMASPESVALDDAEASPHDHSRSFDVTSDRRLVVRSRSHRGLSPSSRSASEGSHNCMRHPSPGFMNRVGNSQAIDNGAPPAMEDARFARRDSAASLSCNASYDAVLYSCADSSLPSRHTSPAPGGLTSLVHAPASPTAAYPYARRQTESPSVSRHSNLNTSLGRGSPETSSLYYSFSNPSAGTAMSISNNPYAGVRMTPEAPAGLVVSQEGISPYTAALQQRHPTMPRGTSAAANTSAGDASGAFRTPTTDHLPTRVVRAYPATASSRSTTAQNSPGAVVLNTSESTMSIPSTFVNPAAAAVGGYGTRPTATPRSHHSDTPPPYNQPSSAPLSPDSASMIVPPGHPAAVAMQRAGLPPYALTGDAARSEASTSSQNSSVHHPYHYPTAPHQQTQQQQQQPFNYGSRLPPLPFMPPSAAAQAAANAAADPPPPPYNGGTQLLHTMDSDLSLERPSSEAAASNTRDRPRHLEVNTAGVPTSPSHDNVSAATTPDMTDVLSDRAAPTQFRSLNGVGSSESQDDVPSDGVSGARPQGRGQAAKTLSHGASPVTMARTRSTLHASMTSANGMTRTAAGLPEMLSGGPAALLASGVEGVKVDGSELAQPRPSETQMNGPQYSKAHAHSAMDNAAEDASADDEDDEDAESVQAGVSGGKKAKNKKKKRARRNRKLKFLEDLPPATEMKFLPPPPPPLPAQYEIANAATQPSAGVGFDEYYAVLVRWYERILADEADFVGLSCPLPPSTANATAAMNASNTAYSSHNTYPHTGGVTSLEASHATLHNSGVLQGSTTCAPCSPATVAGSTPGTTPGSAMFALSSFTNGAGLSPVVAAAPPPMTAAAPRPRRTAGGGEVPVLCPRIEQYVPLSDIPPGLSAGLPERRGAGAAAGDAREHSLLSNAVPNAGETGVADSGKSNTASAVSAAAPPLPQRLHVQHVDRAVQWAKDLNSWWLCYVHPHSFTSRRQHIPQGISLPMNFPPPPPGSHTGSTYGWSPSSLAIPGYEGGPHVHGAGGMGSGHNGMSVLSGTGSIAATMAPENAYATMPMPSYSPYSTPNMAPPPPPPAHQQPYQQQYQQPYQQRQQLQQQQHYHVQPSSRMGVYTMYQ